jgi:hypothetical protein
VNAVSKLIIGAFVLILSVNSVADWLVFFAEEAQLKKVAQWTDYGVFYPGSAGIDTMGGYFDYVEQRKNELLHLYPYLDSKGGLYVDSQSLVSLQQSDNFSFDAGNGITVNPNYLQRYPALDVSGSRIYVDDTETSWVVLVPITYQDQEDFIRSTYQRRREGVMLEAKFFAENDLVRLKNQPVKIIWTATGQSYFTYNTYVDSVSDPIIQVMTQSNSLGDDRLNAFHLDIDSALKVYLGNNSSASVFAELEPTLSELKLDDNFVSLMSFSEFSAYRINESSYLARMWVLPTVILFSLMIILIIQSAAINYERESRRIAVFKMHGYKFWDRYTKPIAYFALTWFIIIGTLVVAYFSPEIELDFGNSRFIGRMSSVVHQYSQFRLANPLLILVVVATFVLLDIIITTLAFKLIESKRVVTTLKGET